MLNSSFKKGEKGSLSCSSESVAEGRLILSSLIEQQTESNEVPSVLSSGVPRVFEETLFSFLGDLCLSNKGLSCSKHLFLRDEGVSTCSLASECALASAAAGEPAGPISRETGLGGSPCLNLDLESEMGSMANLCSLLKNVNLDCPSVLSSCALNLSTVVS